MVLCFYSYAEYQLEPWQIKAPRYFLGCNDKEGGTDTINSSQPFIYRKYPWLRLILQKDQMPGSLSRGLTQKWMWNNTTTLPQICATFLAFLSLWRIAPVSSKSYVSKESTQRKKKKKKEFYHELNAQWADNPWWGNKCELDLGLDCQTSACYLNPTENTEPPNLSHLWQPPGSQAVIFMGLLVVSPNY